MPTFLRFAFAALGAALVTLTPFLAMPALLQFDDPEPGETLYRLEVERLAESHMVSIDLEPWCCVCGFYGEGSGRFSESSAPVRLALSLPEILPPGHVYAPPLVSREAVLGETVPVQLGGLADVAGMLERT